MTATHTIDIFNTISMTELMYKNDIDCQIANEYKYYVHFLHIFKFLLCILTLICRIQPISLQCHDYSMLDVGTEILILFSDLVPIKGVWLFQMCLLHDRQRALSKYRSGMLTILFTYIYCHVLKGNINIPLLCLYSHASSRLASLEDKTCPPDSTTQVYFPTSAFSMFVI